MPALPGMLRNVDVLAGRPRSSQTASPSIKTSMAVY
jgi:hypothetical protein